MYDNLFIKAIDMIKGLCYNVSIKPTDTIGFRKGDKEMERKKEQEHLKYLVLSAIFCAMVYVLTAFVRIPTHQGYIHVGDGIIYIAAALLPLPYAVLTGAIGAGLSDYLSGYPMWVLPTVIIKALTVLSFSHSKATIINKRNIIALLPAFILCVGGYYFSAAILYGDWGVALIDIPTNCIQSAASAALFIFLGLSLDKAGFKKRFLNERKKSVGTID